MESSEVVGKKEKANAGHRRHFPGRHNVQHEILEDHAKTTTKPDKEFDGPAYRRRGRRLIAHGACVADDATWSPHPAAIDPVYTDHSDGLDWSSSIRSIPAPTNPSRKDERIWPEHSSHLRTYADTFQHRGAAKCCCWSQTNAGEADSATKPTDNCTADVYGCQSSGGIKCVFDSVHKNSAYGDDQITDLSRFGSRRKPLVRSEMKQSCDDDGGDDAEKTEKAESKHSSDACQKREEGSAGLTSDHLHQRGVEYDTQNYHSGGASVPLINFSRVSVHNTQTFVPLFPVNKCEPFTTKKQQQQLQEDRDEIRDLDAWKPVPPINELLMAKVAATGYGRKAQTRAK